MGPQEVQQSVPTQQSNEGLLLLKLSYAISTNVFGEIWIAHRNLSFLGTSSKGQTFRFHTPRSEQGIEVELEEHRRGANMFQ